ncbi:hypothetical protein [Nocardioides sp. TF02-7]|uniref:hypothetical protein n=1 Tax=Nocardioides sp. TF02-7 TaxID=2917724 RepID=UPI001F051F60|nr:hypothetical protein [Nocardioides sp. TF02-7]UMG94523.1 hypothetical protein MF408_11460 [Nocardioides sp. TF02-7]
MTRPLTYVDSRDGEVPMYCANCRWLQPLTATSRRISFATSSRSASSDRRR